VWSTDDRQTDRQTLNKTDGQTHDGPTGDGGRHRGGTRWSGVTSDRQVTLPTWAVRRGDDDVRALKCRRQTRFHCPCEIPLSSVAVRRTISTTALNGCEKVLVSEETLLSIAVLVFEGNDVLE
jgi:hypothetical protein